MLFHIVFNTNIGPCHATEIGHDVIRERLQFLGGFIKENIDALTDGPAQLTQSEFYLEVGKRKGYIHMDGFLVFNGSAHLRYNTIRDVGNTVFADLSKGVHFHARPSSDQAIIAYARKDNDRLL